MSEFGTIKEMEAELRRVSKEMGYMEENYNTLWRKNLHLELACESLSTAKLNILGECVRLEKENKKLKEEIKRIRGEEMKGKFGCLCIDCANNVNEVCKHSKPQLSHDSYEAKGMFKCYSYSPVPKLFFLYDKNKGIYYPDGAPEKLLNFEEILKLKKKVTKNSKMIYWIKIVEATPELLAENKIKELEREIKILKGAKTITTQEIPKIENIKDTLDSCLNNTIKTKTEVKQ